MVSPSNIRELTSLLDYAVDIRRDIHKHPETAFEETRTSGLVIDRLRELGLEVHAGIAGTGVVGILTGKKPGKKVIGLRADMDALFIQEESDLPYRSTVDGKMHACGHDGHTAMLLGAAHYLSQRNDFHGKIVFIFQPAEESEGGARVMVEEGLFERFHCDAVYGLHNMPGLPAGKFAIRKGPYFASGDTWQALFEGTGGHGAFPHKGTDPTAALGAFLVAYQLVVARRVPAYETAIVSIGRIECGAYSSPNIIPSEVLVRGTARSYKADVRDQIENGLTDIAVKCAALHGCTAKLEYIRRYPPLVNHSVQTETAIQAAKCTVDSKNLDTEAVMQGGSEDFAFLLEKRPGAYIILGNGAGPENHFVHTPRYNFNDEIIPYGVAYWINLALTELGE